MEQPYSRHVSYSVCVILSLICVVYAGMDITAYEYQRKFHKELTLGECPYRQVSVPTANKSTHIEEQRCNLHKKGVIRSLPRELSDTRNEYISSAQGVVVYLGLCGGESASYLGILHNGECVAVDIASRLTFSDRTMVRAFIGYYRTSLDILDTTVEDVRDGMEAYYKNKYYVKNLSYGTLEIIFVQFRFWNDSQAADARKVTQSDPRMSAFMSEIARRVGEPKAVTTISLSTALRQNYKMKTEKEWNRALRYVQILELQINNRRELIAQKKINPHLKYGLFPFIQDDVKGAVRSADPIVWEKTSMLEVNLRSSMVLVKKVSRKCKRNRTKVCRRVRELRRSLKLHKIAIHKGRALWVSLALDERKGFIKRYTSQIKTFVHVAKKLSKDVRIMKRREKRERLNRKRSKQNSLNEIPPSMSSKHHRIRHLRRKAGRRKPKQKTKLKPTMPRSAKWGWF